MSIWDEIYNLFAVRRWTQHCRLTNRDILKTACQESAIRSREKIRPNSKKFEFRAYVSFWYAINFYGTLGDNGGGSCKAEEVTMIGRWPSVSAFLGVDLSCLPAPLADSSSILCGCQLRQQRQQQPPYRKTFSDLKKIIPSFYGSQLRREFGRKGGTARGLHFLFYSQEVWS